MAKIHKNTGEVFYYNIPKPNAYLGLKSSAYQITVDQNYYKWISCSGPQPYLLNFDGRNWVYVNIPASFGFRLAIDKEGILWFAFLDLYKYEGNAWENYYSSNSDFPNSIISAIFCDEKNNKWLGLISGNVSEPVHLVKFDNENFTTFVSPFNFSVNEFSSIVVNQNEIVWMGTDQNGLLKFDGNLWTNYNTFNSELPTNAIKKVAIEKDSILWIATDKGLTRFDGLNWKTFDTNNSQLPSNQINSIFIEENSTKWITTNKGMLSLSGSELILESKKPWLNNQFNVHLFPNPANNYLTIIMPVELQNSTIDILNIQGKTIKTFNANNNNKPLEVGELSTGIYLIRIQSHENYILKKFVKR